MEREKVKVDIAGTVYLVDLKNQLLHPVEEGLKIVDLKDCRIMMDDEWEYVGHYDLEKREQVVFPDNTVNLPPEHIVEFVLPAYRDLDEVAWQQLHGDNGDPENIDPGITYHVAQIIPIESSILGLDIAENNISDSINQLPRTLPRINIERTEFIVDVMKEEIRQAYKPNNSIQYSEMYYRGSHYILDFDLDTKNIESDDSDNVKEVKIPSMGDSDPVGMSLKTGKTIEEIKDKTDFELIVNRDALAQRLSGILPVIEIKGHPFYVDLKMDALRPKDDFLSEGIKFPDIAYDSTADGKYYWVSYDPVNHEYRELDLREIIELPNNIVIIEIPMEEYLDPVGYARMGGWDLEETIMRYGLTQHSIAREVPWSETSIPEIIEFNRKEKKLDIDIEQEKLPAKEKKNKGPKL
ncbi:hypothetical protein [Pedobacter jeongneungensis]|uniref:hypothetical protein n=1 Tax=Pedobacter jeongneungensis TaxID=947309 RepID=UPI00046AAA87|nr:hypothetical protein [Pedobacter jeongneungensis]